MSPWSRIKRGREHARTWLAIQADLREPSTSLIVAVLGIALIAWSLVHGPGTWQLSSGDAFDYAQIARRVASGRGFTTGALYPAELSFGVSADHPSLLRAPLWPSVVALSFVLFGPTAWAVHMALLPCYLGTVIACVLLATKVAGRVAGWFAGVTVAITPELLFFTTDGLSELCAALWITAALLLYARNAHPLWIGVCCGLAYLTRYNAGVLLVAVLLLQIVRRPLTPSLARAPLLTCVGFVAVVTPWWLRNWLITGDPFFTIYSWTPYLHWAMRGLHQTPMHELTPETTGGFSVDPLDKLAHLLPLMLAQWPLASMNLPACLGVALSCLRLERLGLAFALMLIATTLIASLATVAGRYFVPFLPLTIALGVAAWANHGGRFQALAMALVLAAPLLPSVPREPNDLRVMRVLHASRTADSSKGSHPERNGLATCIAPGTVVLADGATQVAWETDAIAIRLPATGSDFWEIVDRQAVRFARVRRFGWMSRSEFEERFEPRRDCDRWLYELVDGRLP